MSKMEKNLKMEENLLEGTVTITEMSIKGGDLPADYQAKIDVTIEFNKVDPIELALLACGGQSLRVMMQTKLRKEKTATLNAYAKDGFKTTYEWITTKEDSKAIDPAKRAANALGKMDLETRTQFIMASFKVSKEVAEQMAKAM